MNVVRQLMASGIEMRPLLCLFMSVGVPRVSSSSQTWDLPF